MVIVQIRSSVDPPPNAREYIHTRRMTHGSFLAPIGSTNESPIVSLVSLFVSLSFVA